MSISNQAYGALQDYLKSRGMKTTDELLKEVIAALPPTEQEKIRAVSSDILRPLHDYMFHLFVADHFNPSGFTNWNRKKAWNSSHNLRSLPNYCFMDISVSSLSTLERVRMKEANFLPSVSGIAKVAMPYFYQAKAYYLGTSRLLH